MEHLVDKRKLETHGGTWAHPKKMNHAAAVDESLDWLVQNNDKID